MTMTEKTAHELLQKVSKLNNTLGRIRKLHRGTRYPDEIVAANYATKLEEEGPQLTGMVRESLSELLQLAKQLGAM